MGTKMVCRCGEVLRWGQIPNPVEWVFLSDTAFCHLPDTVDTVQMTGQVKRFLQCPACGRLVVFWDKFGVRPQFYVPEPEPEK